MLLVAGFPQRWPEFAPGSSQVGFVVDKVALGQVRVLRFPLPILIPQNSASSESPGAGTEARSGRCAEWTQFGLRPPPPLCEFKKNNN
jgi:hypothetical protein